ncbi:MAG TPA: MFS transporter, partial [Acidobacteriota bacterium]|nr:MFS transporter [Acidobacteriota bacterium]
PTMTAMAVDAHPARYRGVVTSVFTATIELGFSLGSYFLGYIVEVLGYKPMFLIAGSAGILFGAYTLLIGLRLPLPGSSSHLTRLPGQDHTDIVP